MFGKKTIFLAVILILSFIPTDAETIEVPFTLDDRDRLIRLEVEQKSLRNEIISLRNEMNTRFESIDRRFESIDRRFESSQRMMYFILGAIVALFGYLLYDRRTTLKAHGAKRIAHGVHSCSSFFRYAPCAMLYAQTSQRQ